MSVQWNARAAAICVPIRNERAALPALLDALAGQSGGPQQTVLCLLLDGCTDGSAALAREWAERFPLPVVIQAVPAAASPNAGRARRAALALGQKALGQTAQAALLTTDADTVPAPDWIAQNCRALVEADVVAGRIMRRPSDDDSPQDRLEAYLDRLHQHRRRIDPVPWEACAPHHFTGGASLGFRADAYAALGGFEPRPCGEDAAIVDAAHRAGLRVRRDPAVRVTTSSRRDGRAPGGLATHLRHLAQQDDPLAACLVAHPVDAAWQYRGHAQARASFPHLACPDVLLQLALALDRDPGDVARTAAASPNAEAFATRIVPAAPGGVRLIPLAQAEGALDALEDSGLEDARLERAA